MAYPVVLAPLARMLTTPPAPLATSVAEPPLSACLVCEGNRIRRWRPALMTWGRHRRGLPRFRCADCRTIYVVYGT